MKNKYSNGKVVEKIQDDNSPWLKFKKIMLMRKAQAIGVKFEFPESFVGISIAEYDFDSAPDVLPIKDVTPKNETDKFNELYAKEETNQGSENAREVPE